MQKEFKQLEKKFGTYARKANDIGDDRWHEIIQKIQVVIPAGGESKRLRGVTKPGFNKISTPLPNGDTLLEHNIRMYRDAGLSDFILLTGHGADSVTDLVGDGSKLGVKVRYSEDPDKPLATGGAIRRALDNNLIDRTKYMIVQNGGDIVFGYPGNLPREFVSHHIFFEKQGSIATLLSVPQSLVQGSVLKVADGFVEDISYEAYVPIPYHAAATIVSPSIYTYFDTLFKPGEKMEFERTLFPLLAKKHILTAMKVDNQFFLPVKNEKQWEQLTKLFREPAST